MSFASLTPDDVVTAHAFRLLVEDLFNQTSTGLTHHLKFVLPCAGDLAANESPLHLPDSTLGVEDSSGVETDDDFFDGDLNPPADVGCYVFDLSDHSLPSRPQYGWQVGTGDQKRDIQKGRVDLLLRPLGIPGRFRKLGGRLYERHYLFRFDADGRLWLQTRHSGVRVNGTPVHPPSRHFLGRRERISIGPYNFIFEFKVVDEVSFQSKKRKFLKNYVSTEEPYALVSATPSANDLRIRDWVLHGVAGATRSSIIYAGSNVRTGQLVAVKRLRVDAYGGSGREEIRLYENLLFDIHGHRYNRFLMQKHLLLSDDIPMNASHEVYMLWTPLARGDFTRFGVSGMWQNLSTSVKSSLLVQCILGLSALHESGWIHRDIKPANLGVCSLGARPRAVIMDLGQAIRRHPSGHLPRRAHCGTLGFLAPELEDEKYLTYGEKVDVWSMGAVAYYVFGGSIPWGFQQNMFLPGDDAGRCGLRIFRTIQRSLFEGQANTLRWLMGAMLAEDPGRRLSVAQILEIPFVRDIQLAIDSG